MSQDQGDLPGHRHYYLLGRRARQLGRGVTDNPFTSTPIRAADWWQRGWTDEDVEAWKDWPARRSH